MVFSNDQLSIGYGLFDKVDTMEWPLGTIKNLSSSSNAPYILDAAISGDSLYALSKDQWGGTDEMWLYRSDDLGLSWSSSNKSTIGDSTEDVNFPSIKANGDMVFVTFYDASTDKMKITVSLDKGKTWTHDRKVNIVDTSNDVGIFNDMVVSGQSVFVAYYDSTDKKLMFSRSGDSGLTWAD